MANTATATLNVQLTGDPAGPLVCQPVTLTFNAAVGARQFITCTNNTVVTVPTGTTLCIIIPPAGNAVTWTLKSVAQDVGPNMHVTNWTALSFNSVATFVINTAGSITFEMIFI